MVENDAIWLGQLIHLEQVNRLRVRNPKSFEHHFFSI